MTKSKSEYVSIDRTKTLQEDPRHGHNRWHPDIKPAIEVEPGTIVGLETRAAFDGFIKPDTRASDLANAKLSVVHPLTGPVYVKGAEPGDVLEVTVVEVAPEKFGFTVQVPGFGFLRDEFTDPYLVRWNISDGFATSDELPGVRIPGAPFMGVIGLAPSHDLLEQINRREAALVERGGVVLLPDPEDAIPAGGGIASNAMRTIAPHENGGNVDIKQLTQGTVIRFPVYTSGGLFSVGDAHFAQGDGEACGTAIEMSATCYCSFNILKGLASRRNINDIQFSREDYFAAPEIAVPRRFFATAGQCVSREGVAHSEDATLAAKNALLNMIDHLIVERGFTKEQAYAICSVAVDLKISELVDVPNFIVSAFLPLDIFVEE